MQQRRLRLGDILDDYCPRERRITNHAVVAMVEETVKQTRCTTCDAEHEFKNAKVPSARRRKTGELTAQLVDGGPKLPVDVPDETMSAEDVDIPEPLEQEEPAEMSASAPDTADVDVDGEPEAVDTPEGDSEEWPVHRRLIRATLPRPEGQTPERKAPDFTFRPAGGKFDSHRNNNQRNRGPRGARQAQGSGQTSRFGGQRQAGQGQRGAGGQGAGGQGGGGPHGQRHGNRPAQGGGNRPGQQGRGSRGGRKRGR